MNQSEGQQSMLNDARALDNSLKLFNEMAGLKAPGIQNKVFTDPALDPKSAPSSPPSPPQKDCAPQSPPINPPAQAQPATSKLDVSPAHTLGRKIFFTGRLCSGKDFVAGKLGGNIQGFADPMYALVELLFPGVKVTATTGKEIPGVRKLLQQLGQWGRNEINNQYPLTAERAMFCQMIRSIAHAREFELLCGADLKQFGTNKDIWVDALIRRVETEALARLDGFVRAIATNCRFPNEYHRLTESGWQHWCVVCSPQTLERRLKSRGLTPQSPEVKDLSEQMAINLEKQLQSKLAQPGNRLQVVWSDESVPSPSPRLYTVEQFVNLPTE